MTMTPVEPTIDDTIQSVAGASDPDNDQLQYEWFVDGQKQNASSPSVNWSNPSAGEYTVTVVVKDGKGGEARDSVSFTVTPAGVPVVTSLTFPPALVQAINLDPPDPNYKMIAEPKAPMIPRGTAQAGVPQALIDALNALYDNLAQTLGVEQAYLQTLERAQGAAAANDFEWYSKHINALVKLSAQWARLLNEQPSKIAAVATAWVAAGLPPDFEKILGQMDLGPELMKMTLQAFLDQDPGEAAGSLSSTLTDPELRAALQGAAVNPALPPLPSPPVLPPDPTPLPTPGGFIAEALDANRNGVLDDSEIRKAIQMWILGDTVPGTDQTIDDGTIRARSGRWWCCNEDSCYGYNVWVNRFACI